MRHGQGVTSSPSGLERAAIGFLACAAVSAVFGLWALLTAPLATCLAGIAACVTLLGAGIRCCMIADVRYRAAVTRPPRRRERVAAPAVILPLPDRFDWDAFEAQFRRHSS